ncbi:MAG: hypothetical protein ACREH9_08265, partial [Pseudomonadota bacterium]
MATVPIISLRSPFATHDNANPNAHYARDFTIFCFGVSALTIGLMTTASVLDVWAQSIGVAALSTALLFLGACMV